MNSSQQRNQQSKKRSASAAGKSTWSWSTFERSSDCKEKQTTIASFFLPTPAVRRPQKRAKTVTPSHCVSKNKSPYAVDSSSSHSDPPNVTNPLSSPPTTAHPVSSEKPAPPPQTTKSQPSKKKKKKATQMYLDLGQKSFGKQTVCSICGMLFVHGVEEDRITHERVCRNYTQGVSFRNWNQARIVTSTTTSTTTATISSNKNKRNHTSKKGVSAKTAIVEIRSSDARSSSLKEKVHEIRAIAHQELGFAPNSHTAPFHTSFVFVQDQRAVGLLLVEPVSRASLLHTQTLERLSERSRPCTMGIHTIWVHKQFRHQQIASQLVDAARDQFQYGGNLPLDQMAFSSPTQAGIHFATRYLQQRNEGEVVKELMIYDCD